MRREHNVPENARAFIIQEVIRNAEMIWRRIEEQHIDKDLYARSTDCQDLLTMPMLRICELVSEYRSVFEEVNPAYPWADVAKMRSKIAHPTAGSTLISSGMQLRLTCPDLSLSAKERLSSHIAPREGHVHHKSRRLRTGGRALGGIRGRYRRCGAL